MTQNVLKPTLEKLGLRQSELAKLLDVSIRTVNQWAREGQALPGAVAGYLRLLEVADEKIRASEFERLIESDKRLSDGLYRIGYRASGEHDGDHALAVLRNGKLIGADRHGGMFEGSYRYDRRRATNIIELRLEIPPDGLLISGLAVGPAGASLSVICSIAKAVPVSRTTVEIAGRMVAIELSFLSPLPN